MLIRTSKKGIFYFNWVLWELKGEKNESLIISREYCDDKNFEKDYWTVNAIIFHILYAVFPYCLLLGIE